MDVLEAERLGVAHRLLSVAFVLPHRHVGEARVVAPGLAVWSLVLLPKMTAT